jgi:hypothetical protein
VYDENGFLQLGDECMLYVQRELLLPCSLFVPAPSILNIEQFDIAYK